jgi:hypothetical protein
MATFGGTPVVTREELVYAGNNNRVDIMVRNEAGTFLFELKTESVYNMDGFTASVKKDGNKLLATNAVKEEYWTEGQATLYSIVFTASPPGHAAMVELSQQYKYELNPAWSVPNDDPVKTWWKKKQLIRS